MKRKNVIDLDRFSDAEIRIILETAKEMKKFIQGDVKKLDALKGKSIVTLFYEPSTRTRTSFELAGKYLGADVVNITSGNSSVVKGESLRDTLYTIEAMGIDAVVIRHPSEGAADIAEKVYEKKTPREKRPLVINAGDGAHAHPTQALLDIFTIEQHFKQLTGLKVAIIGDILHSRVARSDIIGMRQMGMEVHLAGPKTLLPRFLDQEPGIFIHEHLEDALEDADVINVLRIQLERQAAGFFPTTREYAKFFGLNEDRLKLAKPDAIVLHPGPQNMGLEISPKVAYSDRSKIRDQVQNGVAIRMAVLLLTLCGGE
ncbi:MAG: aspartate carbamoyltransferase catalytic subunit [Selenomonadaceae bacterium]|nr:aspartate carbamoyltransferase catalytic subunit [Selenomonadaceae bacterium]